MSLADLKCKAFDLLRALPNKRSAMFFSILATLTTNVLSVARKLPLISAAVQFAGILSTTALVAVSPVIPSSARYKIYIAQNWGLIRDVYLVTLFFCLVVNALGSWWLVDTWAGHDPNRVYFSRDFHNIIQYLVIAPTYVTLSVCLIAATINGWPELKKTADNSTIDHTSNAVLSRTFIRRIEARRLLIFFLLSLCVTAAFIVNFIDELLNPNLVKKLYWFATQATPDIRVLNAMGAYYLLMNAILLLITCMACLCYLSMSIEVTRIATHIETSNFARQRNEALLVEAVKEYCICYYLAKSLIFVYAANIVIWKMSPGGHGINVDAAIIALAIIGIFCNSLSAPLSRIQMV